jgi:hypothetical protein
MIRPANCALVSDPKGVEEPRVETNIAEGN